jgi:hypothetical protein
MPVSKLAVSESTMKSAAIILVLLEERPEVLGADLLLALDDELDVAGQLPPDFRYEATAATWPSRRLVVGGAAAVEPAVALRGLEGRRDPRLVPPGGCTSWWP